MNVSPESRPLPAPSSGESAPEAPQASLAPEERSWGMLAHLSSLVGGLFTVVLGGWGCFIGPLVVWLVKKDTMPFVNDQGKEAMNFNITVVIACAILLVLQILLIPLFLSAAMFSIGLIFVIPLWTIIGVAWLVFTVVAAVKAKEGVRYRYPLTLRLIK